MLKKEEKSVNYQLIDGSWKDFLVGIYCFSQKELMKVK